MSNLQNLRQQIDKTDKQLLKVLAKRFALTKKVGEYKKEHDLKPQDRKRERQIFIQRKKWAKELGLDSVLVTRIFRLIIRKVCQNHREIKNEK